MPVPPEKIRDKTVTDEYGNPHVLHINKDTGGTVHKHSDEFSGMCPYCQPDIDYGMGIDLGDIPGL